MHLSLFNAYGRQQHINDVDLESDDLAEFLFYYFPGFTLTAVATGMVAVSFVIFLLLTWMEAA